jgi:prephenate dehydratase
MSPPTDNAFTQVNQLLLKHVESADLRRLDRSASTFQATYLIACPNDAVLAALMDDMSAQLVGCEFSFVEQDNTLGG